MDPRKILPPLLIVLILQILTVKVHTADDVSDHDQHDNVGLNPQVDPASHEDQQSYDQHADVHLYPQYDPGTVVVADPDDDHHDNVDSNPQGDPEAVNEGEPDDDQQDHVDWDPQADPRWRPSRRKGRKNLQYYYRYRYKKPKRPPFPLYRPYRPHCPFSLRRCRLVWGFNGVSFGFRKVCRFDKPTVIIAPTDIPIITKELTTTEGQTTSAEPTTKPSTTMPPAPCREGSTVLDECERACVCRGGRPSECYRVRREFSHMSKEERRRYLFAVLFASTQDKYKSKYEELLTIRKRFVDTEIDSAKLFLPWNRWFLLQYENLLREVNCKITVPYWDWSLVAASPYTSEFWNDTYGFGGNGEGFPACVRTGLFSVGNNWKLIKSAGGGCLQRNFVSTPGIVPDVVAVAKVLAKNLSSFSDFELMVRVNLNQIIFFAIGGTMITADNAAAPEYFPHKSFVDKIWAEWQAKSTLHRFHEFFFAQNTSMPGTNFTARDLLSNKNLPGGVKVKYASPDLGNWTDLIKEVKKMAEMNPEKLDKLPRMPTAKVNETMFEAFNVSKVESQKAEEMQKDLETKVKVDSSELKGMEKMIGLKATDIKKMKSSG